MTPATAGVLFELAIERERQSDTGRDADDDAKPIDHWSWLLQKRAMDMAHPYYRDDAVIVRRALVETAAIAVAAIESIDRRTSVRGDQAPHVRQVAGEAPQG